MNTFKLRYFKLAIFVFGLLFCLSFSNSEKIYHSATSISVSTPQALWHDLVTPDLRASKAFYGKVFGWTFKDYNFKGYNHAHIYSNGSLIGGMIEVKAAKSSTWIGSFPVTLEDLKSLKRGIKSKGLKPALEIVNIPERGQQIIFESPQGEEFALILENEMTRSATNKETKNTLFGMELWSSDVKRSKSFYENAFGVNISKKEADGQPYWVFADGGVDIAWMITNPVTNQGSQWVPYMKSNNLDASVGAIESSSGVVLVKPTEEVRSGKVSIAQDPHGAIFVMQKNN
ncbi:MAG: VOC family protein [Bacteroidota bacterium]